MKLKFYKYHGTGNDFILIDSFGKSAELSAQTIRGLCHRRFGAGADGLIMLEDEPGYDFRMIYFNSDGRESSMCGNGGRCAVAFYDFLSPCRRPVSFMAVDGAHTAVIIGKEQHTHTVRLKMNDVPDCSIHGPDYRLDTGSPHLVRFVDRSETMDVGSLGRAIRNQADFQPGGINVNFVSTWYGGLFVRTYERGVEEETLSCGTGVTASALAHARREKIEEATLPVHTPGGLLKVSFRQTGDVFTDIWLEGPAVKVYEGFFEMDETGEKQPL